MDYQQAEAYLYSLLMHGVKLGLDNIRTLLSEFEHPELQTPHVLVGGTNGKGSVTAMLSATLSHKGLKVGSYTSPHLISFTERIRINDAPISQGTIARLTQSVRERIELLMGSEKLKAHPTFFEVATLLAWLAFAEEKADVVIMEVGLGGRWDATNASEPCISAITSVDLEHTRFLGPTVEAIAREKSGVMRRDATCVTASRDPRVLGVLREEADARGCQLCEVSETVKTSILLANRAFTRLRFDTDLASYGPLDLPLAGRHQVLNAAVAVALAERLPVALRPSPEELVRGLEASSWPGRLERHNTSPRVLLDGAHNPHAAQSLVDYLNEFERGPKTLVFASVKDKDVVGMAKLLFPLFQSVVLTAVQNKRTLTPSELRTLVPGHAESFLAPTTSEALLKARDVAGADGLVVVAGSLYLVGEAKAALADSPD